MEVGSIKFDAIAPDGERAAFRLFPIAGFRQPHGSLWWSEAGRALTRWPDIRRSM
ncbi:MAG: hypothetical protein ACK5Q5_20515 [Planctomycetaceae bacterium]